MLFHRTSNGAALAVALALGMTLGMSPRAARAQSAYEPGGAEPSCVSYAADGCAAAGDACGSGVCRDLRGGGLTCVPTNALLCCTSAEQCYRDGDGVAFECVEVSGLSGTDIDTIGRLCLPPVDWCTGEDDVLSLEELDQNLSTGTNRVLRWAEGDYDRDGVRNGEEERLGTDPCTAPPPRAYWDGEGCVPIATGCHFGEPCLATDGVAGTCEVTDDELGTECVPDEGDLTWCGGSFPCGDDQTYVAESADRHWCVPDECEGAPEVESLLDCIYVGENLVGYAAGDCDGDGTVNDLDDTPCGEWPEDAGPPPNDAGQANFPDAGSDGFDAGGQPIDPSFEGGGGCRCRASGAPTDIPLAPLVGVALGLGLIIGRRRR